MKQVTIKIRVPYDLNAARKIAKRLLDGAESEYSINAYGDEFTLDVDGTENAHLYPKEGK